MKHNGQLSGFKLTPRLAIEWRCFQYSNTLGSRAARATGDVIGELLSKHAHARLGNSDGVATRWALRGRRCAFARLPFACWIRAVHINPLLRHCRNLSLFPPHPTFVSTLTRASLLIVLLSRSHSHIRSSRFKLPPSTTSTPSLTCDQHALTFVPAGLHGLPSALPPWRPCWQCRKVSHFISPNQICKYISEATDYITAPTLSASALPRLSASGPSASTPRLSAALPTVRFAPMSWVTLAAIPKTSSLVMMATHTPPSRWTSVTTLRLRPPRPLRVMAG